MKRIEIKEKLKEITDSCTGIKVFFLDKYNNILDSDIENGVLDEFRDSFAKELSQKYCNNENFTTPNLSSADERNNALFVFDFDRLPHEFGFLDVVNSLPANKELDKYQVRDHGLNNLKAIIIRLKSGNGNVVSFYQYIHHSQLISSGKGAFLTTHKTRVVKLEHDVLRLNHRFIFAKLGDDYLIENVKALEKELGFDKVIHAKAKEYSRSLMNMAIVDNLQKFNGMIENETSFARKFVKVFKSSAVIEKKLSNEKVIHFAMSKQFYQERLKITDDQKFDLNSIQRCNTFLKLLDDEFLKSELTNQDYIVRVKDRA
ncbi:anti-phage protein KwaB [Photobacterium ganghwense]|uniref:anti-phage protein KwaB n=1 Tax=Photobacterium ganghwense TaxID=320778 RepID=UPI001C2DC984|nr:anti-phage protein KwaB [Photobacterium ganghwense]MBV1842228.1 DUF4868 domain-containing protein [Photobacterium ganghwense]